MSPATPTDEASIHNTIAACLLKAKNGCAESQYQLGQLYLEGDGISQDHLWKARYWLEQAAQQSHGPALLKLGAMILKGIDCHPDPCVAAAPWIQAVQAGEDLAAHKLATIEPELRQLALSGNQKAALTVTRMYASGFGVGKSDSLAWAWIVCAKHHCAPSDMPCVAQVVDGLFAFYESEIGPCAQKEGALWFESHLKNFLNG